MAEGARLEERRQTVLVVREEAAGAVLEAALRGAGLTVLRATTMSGGIQACMEATPDLAIVELELPQADRGPQVQLALVQLFRAADNLRHVPVILLSAREDEAQRIGAFAQGCDDFLPTSVPVAELVARVWRHLAVSRRFDGLLEENSRLRALTVTDGLTGLANHRHFHERLADEFRRAQRYDDPLALIVLDVDHFKQINEQYGFPIGDDVLRAIGGCVRDAVRDTDFVARCGGEEFAVLLPKTHLAGALTAAERMSSDLKDARLGARAVRVSATFGLSSFPGRAVTTPDQLLRTADEALFRAKHEGRNRIGLHQTSVTGHAGTASS